MSHFDVEFPVLKWCHAECAHGGRGATLNELRRSGYWVVNGNSAVRIKLSKCIQCRKLKGKLDIEKTADLPSSRLMEVPPFTYCGVDMFGPFIIKQRQSEVKRYGAMFTCMNSCAVHTEVIHSLDTDSFIQVLRQIIARRGIIRTIYSGNGSNFIRADNELKRAFEEVDNEKIKHSCKNLVEIGSSGNETHLLQATWVVSEKDKYAQLKGFCLHCCKLMVKPLTKSPC